jgi:mannose-6-phosphate isomerase-like protein (cupin superfamily)
MEIVSHENAEHYTWGGVCDGWHLLKTGALSVIQERVPPGGTEVKHYHEEAHQFFFVLSGEATLEIEDQKWVLGPRQGISVPPKVPHRLLNETKQELSFIVVSAPKSHGDRVLVG